MAGEGAGEVALESGGEIGGGVPGGVPNTGGFGGPQVCEIVGITYRQLDYWDRTDLLKPSLAGAHGSGTQRRYSYRDLVQLKIIKGLLDAGVKLQAARRAIVTLRLDHGHDWQTASLVLNGVDSVVALDGDQLVDLVRRGQGVLNVVPLGPMVSELEASIVALGPPSDPVPDAPRTPLAAEGG